MTWVSTRRLFTAPLQHHGGILENGTARQVPHAVVYVNGQEVGRGSYVVDVAMNEQVVLRVEAEGYLPSELVIRPDLDTTRPRTLTAPVRLQPDPASKPPG